MFESFLADCVATPDASLDERLRANELETRRLAAERAAIVAVTQTRGSYAPLHRSVAGYLRATVNTGPGAISRDRKLARLLSDHPQIGEALWAGHITIDHALQIERLHANPRIRGLLAALVEVLVDLAEHTSFREFHDQVTSLIAPLDADGAFDDLADSVDGRRASVAEVGGEVVVTGHGGDPVQAAHMVSIFEAFRDREYQADVAGRRDEFGDEADQHPLRRTPAQRGFDALAAIFAAAYASPEGRRLPDLVTNLVVDEHSAHDALATAGIVLPNGDHLDLDEAGQIANPSGSLDDVAAQLDADPEAFLRRRCETASGSPIHSSVLVRALLTGHVRRVVMASRSVVIDYGARQRLFTGLARQAALLMMRRCEAPGCEMPARWSQVDHNIEWSDNGPTDQRNRVVLCGAHNRDKHRQQWRARRNIRGRAYAVLANGTVVLPAGERCPNLSGVDMGVRVWPKLSSPSSTYDEAT